MKRAILAGSTGFLCSFIFSSWAMSAPVINEVTGVLKEGQQIIINGQDFGADGPTLHVFEDFEDGETGSQIDLDATVGRWDSYQSQYYPPTYHSRARSGNFSGQLSSAANGQDQRQAGFQKNFPAALEYFLSYAVQVPPGTYFPQSNASAPIGEFPNESVWKFAWIRDYENDPDSSPGDDDKCLPSHINYARIATVGNGLNSSKGSSSVTIHAPGDTWWQWGSWNRFAMWASADSDNPATVNGREWVQGLGEGVEQVQRTDNNHPVFASGTVPYQWTKLHINGWIRTTSLSKPVALLYDDIYFATGPNAAARVELGNSPIYSNATKLAIITPDNWDETSITATVRSGAFRQSEEVYLFVINSDNEPSPGFGPLTFEGIISVSPPGNLRVDQ